MILFKKKIKLVLKLQMFRAQHHLKNTRQVIGRRIHPSQANFNQSEQTLIEVSGEKSETPSVSLFVLLSLK